MRKKGVLALLIIVVVGVVIIGIRILGNDENSSDLNERKQPVLVFDTVNNVLSCDTASIEDIYQNINFAEGWDERSLSVSIPQKVYQYIYTYEEDTEHGMSKEECVERMRYLLLEVFGHEMDDNLVECDTNRIYLTYNNELLSATCYSTGTYSIVHRINNDWIPQNQKPILKKVDLRCEGTTDGVMVSDSKTLADALVQVDRLVHETLQSTNFTEELKARTAIRYGDADGGCYVIRYERVLNGLAMDEAGDFQYVYTGIARPTYLNIMLNQDGDVCRIANSYSMNLVSKTELEDKVLTLTSAFEAMQAHLAPYGVYRIADAELRYCCMYYSRELEEGEQDLLTYSPMWCFTVKSENTTYVSNLDPRMTIYVDALTGDVYMCDCTSQGTTPYFDLSQKEQ